MPFQVVFYSFMLLLIAERKIGTLICNFPLWGSHNEKLNSKQQSSGIGGLGPLHHIYFLSDSCILQV